MREFVLKIHDLDAAGKTFSSEVSATWLRNALEATELGPAGLPGKVEVRYSKTGNDVVILGRVQAPLQAPCSRCLEPARIDIDAELTLFLVPSTAEKASFARGRAGPKEETVLEDEVASLDTYEGDEIVLDPFVREALLLEAPSYPLCKESCQGIAPPPEQQGPAPVDPRLAPLLELAQKAKGKTQKELVPWPSPSEEPPAPRARCVARSTTR
jgi:uncharacterized protein